MTDAARRRLEAEVLAKSLLSCPECGLLCKKIGGFSWDGQLFDLASHLIPWEYMPDWFLADVLRQGIAGRLGSHRCPPAGVETKGEAA